MSEKPQAEEATPQPEITPMSITPATVTEPPEPEFVPPEVDTRLPAPGEKPVEISDSKLFDPEVEHVRHVEPMARGPLADEDICSLVVTSYPKDADIFKLGDFFASIAVLRHSPVRQDDGAVKIAFQKPEDLTFALEWFRNPKKVHINGHLCEVAAIKKD